MDEPAYRAAPPVDATVGGKVKVDWKRVGAAGSVIGGIAVMHGLKSRKWRSIHSFGVALGIAATVVPLVERVRRMSATNA
jgi:orotate phosphoribosyltransferase-like protein